MTRGGARPNAGRKAGAATKKTKEIADKAAEEGITPLEYLLSVMRNEVNEPKERVTAAIAAAPYVHAKLSSVEATVTGKDGGPLQMNWTIDFVAPEDEG
jgi:hypothetical protein